MISLIKELWRYVRVTRNYWMVPILAAMLLFGGLVVFTKGSAVAPFLYTLF